MKSQKIKIYYIEDSYIDYLRQFDKKVPYNKNKTRPYIGIVYTYNNINYFAPLSSPKPKHIKMSKKAVDIFKIENGKLGIVNLNNMIPTPISCLTEVIPLVTDKTYKQLLLNQSAFINDHKKQLLSKVNTFQLQYNKGFLSKNELDRCCNFPLLEEKCKEWENLREIEENKGEQVEEILEVITENPEDEDNFEM